MRVYQCEDSLEGIFTAIYNIYEDKCDHRETCISITDELILFAEYISVKTNASKAVKVARTLRKQFGEENFFLICLALSSEAEQKAQAVYRTVERGLAGKVRTGHLFDNMADDDIHRAYSLGRAANNEYLHMRGFLRFEELKMPVGMEDRKILYAEMSPKNHLMSFLMPHFADRLPMENFMIFDKQRKLYGVHKAGEAWYMVQGDVTEEHTFDQTGFKKTDHKRSDGEEIYSMLFGHFCKTVSVEERENKNLQRNMLPLRFREHMTEFR